MLFFTRKKISLQRHSCTFAFTVAPIRIGVEGSDGKANALPRTGRASVGPRRELISPSHGTLGRRFAGSRNARAWVNKGEVLGGGGREKKGGTEERKGRSCGKGSGTRAISGQSPSRGRARAPAAVGTPPGPSLEPGGGWGGEGVVWLVF